MGKEHKESIILTMNYEDEKNKKMELISMFDAENGQRYAALLPLNDDETAQDDANIELVRLMPYINDDMQEDYRIEGIPTEEELREATEAFRNSMAATDELTISIENEAGEKEDWKIIDTFDMGKQKYIALIPVPEIVSGENNIYLMRLDVTEKDGKEEYNINPIAFDIEYDEAVKIFENRILQANSD